MLIDVEDITKVYDDGTEALRGVTFHVTDGEYISVMGPSGSGKSTLLHILGFLDKHTDGRYAFEGRTFEDYTPRQLARLRNERMGFVFQMFNLLGRTSVLYNVMLPLYYSDVPEREWRDRAERALEAVGLTHRLDHEPSMLSGGERQRVAMARALVNDPQIIFADEPTGNLDTETGESIMAELDELNQSGHTVIVITHEQVIAEHAKRMLYLVDGRIESDAPIAERRRPRK